MRQSCYLPLCTRLQGFCLKTPVMFQPAPWWHPCRKKGISGHLMFSISRLWLGVCTSCARPWDRGPTAAHCPFPVFHLGAAFSPSPHPGQLSVGYIKGVMKNYSHLFHPHQGPLPWAQPCSVPGLQAIPIPFLGFCYRVIIISLLYHTTFHQFLLFSPTRPTVP